MKSKSTWILIAIVIAALVIAVPAGIKLGSQAYADFWANIWDMFKRNSGDGFFSNSTISGHSGISYKIYYVDGTTSEFTPSQYSIIPLTITDTSGKAISKISLMVNAVLEYSDKTVKDWATTGACYVDIYKDNAKIQDNIKTADLTAAYTRWTSGENMLLGQLDVYAGIIEISIENLGKGEGTYEWRTTGSFTITVNWTDGTSESRTSESLESQISFGYQKTPTTSITAFTVTVYSYAL